jgi:MFS family permease
MAGYIVGAMLLSAAAFTFAIPVIAQRMAKRGRRDVLLPMALILLPLGGVVYLLALIQNNFTVAFCMMAIGYGVLAGLSVLPPIVVALTAPANYRGRLTAISIASVNVIGLGGGSFCVAALADHFFKGPRGIGEALFTMAIIVVPIAWLLIYASWKPYREGITGSLNA